MTLARNTTVSRLAALVLLVTVVAGPLAGLGGMLASRYEAALSEIRDRQRAIERYRQAADRAPDLQRRIDRLRENTDADTLLLAPGTDSGATATIQRRLEAVIAAAGAQFTSVQALPAVDGGDYRRIGVRVQFASDMKALVDLLLALEFGRPATVVDNLFVHARSARAVGVVNPLAVRADVFAFMPKRP